MAEPKQQKGTRGSATTRRLHMERRCKQSRLRDLHSIDFVVTGKIPERKTIIDHGLYEGEMDSWQGNRERDEGSRAKQDGDSGCREKL